LPLVEDLQETIATTKQLQQTVIQLLLSMERLTERVEALEKIAPRPPSKRARAR
jgi:hypothetical protein